MTTVQMSDNILRNGIPLVIPFGKAREIPHPDKSGFGMTVYIFKVGRVAESGQRPLSATLPTVTKKGTVIPNEVRDISRPFQRYLIITSYGNIYI